jgi:hypothetical protein
MPYVLQLGNAPSEVLISRDLLDCTGRKERRKHGVNDRVIAKLGSNSQQHAAVRCSRNLRNWGIARQGSSAWSVPPCSIQLQPHGFV